MIKDLIVKFLVLLIRFYQKYISIIFGASKCRFNPTCSNYCIEAIRKKGLVKGLLLGIYRILRCNPFNSGGNDFVK